VDKSDIDSGEARHDVLLSHQAVHPLVGDAVAVENDAVAGLNGEVGGCLGMCSTTQEGETDANAKEQFSHERQFSKCRQNPLFSLSFESGWALGHLLNVRKLIQ
jgi:hypothetical protein